LLTIYTTRILSRYQILAGLDYSGGNSDMAEEEHPSPYQKYDFLSMGEVALYRHLKQFKGIS
jgi:hypothetical protein